METQATYGPEALTTPQSTELTRLDKEIHLMEAQSRARFALTPVGQALKQFEVNQRMGQMYAASTIVPKTYQGNAANCAIAVDMAVRMNANPIMVMQNLYIVNGHPAWSSAFLIATINTCGRFEPLKYRFFTDGKIGKVDYYETEYYNGRPQQVKKTFDGSKIDNLCCVAYTTAKGSTEVLESSVISCRLAAQEGWWTKNQSKWPNMTEQMLRYRAAAFWQRAYAPEISMGFHTVEEQRDIVDVTYTDESATSYDAKPAAGPVSIADIALQNAARLSAVGEFAEVDITASAEAAAKTAEDSAETQQQTPAPGEDNTADLDTDPFFGA